MKINKLHTIGFSVFLLLTLLVVSCSKEENSTPFDENLISKRLKFVDVNTRINNKITGREVSGIIVEWDEWGRASKKCDGWGLCNANWFPSSQKKAVTKRMNNNGGATLLEFDKSLNKYYIDILLAETVPLDIPVNALTLKIDEDFTLEAEKSVSKKLTFNQGSYTFNPSLGEYGGYRIYLN